MRSSTQIKYHFDRKSNLKILKGTLIAASGGAALFILNLLKSINFGNFESVAVILVPALINEMREWMKGDTKE